MPESESLFLTDDTADAALDELLAEYFARLDAGEIVDPNAFIAAHPDFASELTEYFDTAAEIERMAGPVLPQAVAAVDVLYGRQVEDPTAVDDTHPGVATDDSVCLDVARVSRPVRAAASSRPSAGSPATESPGARTGRETRATDVAAAGDEPVEETVAATVAAGSPESGVAVPRQFGRYIVERCLGQGAMGAVFLAEDAGLGRKVAIKVPRTAPGDGLELVERFHREARSAAGLSHRNICPVYDVGEVRGISYLTMAWIAGRPLKDFVHPEHLQPERQVAAVIRKLALALDHAHRAGIVHRDLKPANIMIDAEREPVIMDFGLARRIDLPADLRVTQSGVIVGTPAYMSPEQVESDHDRVGPASDIYSLGVILYELLTGDLPFKGSLASVLGQILSNEPPPPSLLRPDLDRMLEAICLKMLAKQPEDRYASMRDVAEALSEYLRASRTSGGLAGDSARLPAFDREDLGRPVGLAGLRSRLHEQQQRAEALIRLRRYDVALRILESMVAVREPSLTPYTNWAERELPRVREALAAADVDHDEARTAPSGRYASELELVEPRRSFWYIVPVAAAVLVLVAWGIVALLNASGSGDGARTEANRRNEARAESDDAARRATADAAPPDRSAAPESGAAAAGAAAPDAQRDERQTQQFTAPDALTSIAVTPDGSAVLATCADGRVYIWSLENGEPSQPLEAGGADLRHLVVSADGQRIAAVGGHSVRVWERDGRIAGIVPLDETPASIGLSPDGSQVFAAFRSIGPRMRGPRGVPFGPDSISRGDAIARYDVATGERQGGLSPLFGSFLGATAAFSADGQRAAIASHIGRMTVVDLSTFTAPSGAPWAERPVGPAAFGMGEIILSGNGRRLLTSGAVTSLWDATDGSYLRELHARAGQGAALSWDGHWLLTPTADSGFALWRIDGQSPLATFPGHRDRISGLAFVPGRKLAVSASLDQTLRVWQLPDAFVPSSAETEAAANQPRVPEYQRP